MTIRLAWPVILSLTISGGANAAAPAASYPASDEIMSPTRHGMRATPELMKLLSGFFVENANPTRDLGLSDEQAEKMADVLARRCMESAHAHGRQWRDLLEFVIESEMSSNGRYKGEQGVEFARRYRPMIEEMRRLTQTVMEDSRPFLSPQQVDLMEREETRLQEFLDSMDQRMEQWESGNVAEDGVPYRASKEAGVSAEDLQQRNRERKRFWAEQLANRSVAEFSPENWGDFVDRTASFFSFTDEQRGQAERIRSSFAARVEEIMDPDWKSRLKQNRMRSGVASMLGRQPGRVWYYHLEREYRQLTEPVVSLRDEFRDEIIGLANDAQRREAFQKIAAAAEAHGAQPEELRGMESLLTGPAGPWQAARQP